MSNTKGGPDDPRWSDPPYDEDDFPRSFSGAPRNQLAGLGTLFAWCCLAALVAIYVCAGLAMLGVPAFQ